MLNFGDALEALKGGQKIFRSGWSGSELFIRLGEFEREHPMHQEGLKMNIIYLETTSGITLWTASQTDVLANDWNIL